MEVKNFSITAILIIIACVFAGAWLANRATSYTSYDAAGRPTGQSKPKVNAPTMRKR